MDIIMKMCCEYPCTSPPTLLSALLSRRQLTFLCPQAGECHPWASLPFQLYPHDPGTSSSISRVAHKTVSHLYMAQTGLSVVLYRENMSEVVENP